MTKSIARDGARRDAIRIGLYLGAAPNDGGVYQFSQTLLQACAQLPAAHFEVHAVYGPEAWAAQLEAHGVSGQHARGGRLDRAAAFAWVRTGLPIAPFRALARGLHPLSRQLRALNCLLWLFPAQDRWAYLAPVEAMGFVHDLMHRYCRDTPEFTQGLYALRERHYGAMARWSRAISCESDCGRQQMHESYDAPLERLLVLRHIAPAAVTAAASGALPPGLPDKFFFYPAQFWPHKNHRRLFEALARLRARDPHVTLALAGGLNREYENLAAHARALGLADNVRFLGYVPEEQMAALYRAARALVYPTLFGPTNLPPLEALAAGCPMALSGIYAMPEQAGDAALYFDPRSVADMAQAMQRLWEDDALCGHLARRGQERHRQWGLAQFSAQLARNVEQALSLPPR